MKDKDLLTIGLEVGKKIMAHAEGDPARTLAYGAAAALAVAGTVVAYGTYVYTGKLWDVIKSD